MKEYIENIIPRLKEFSQSLDRKETFVDVPWVLVDSEGGFQKYIFKRNGELVMSLNGVVTIGKWEYLAPAKSLLIDRIKDKILLNQNFIDSAVMVLNQDGGKNGNFILANEILISDLDVATYLKKLFYLKHEITEKKLPSGTCLEFHGYPDVIGSKVTIEAKSIADTVLDGGDKKYVIEDGVLKKILRLIKLSTDKGEIEIEYQVGYGEAEVGNIVFRGDGFAPDGKYRLGFMNHIEVQDGRIITTPFF